MGRYRGRVLAALAAMTWVGGSAAASDLEAGKKLADQGSSNGAMACVACHGPDGGGNAAAGFPRLAGLDAAYIARQIQAYREGARGAPVMAPIVAGLSETDVANVAAWYASLAVPKATPAPADEALLEEGERLATRGNWANGVPACVTCHGPGGRGVDENFPPIAGQHATYLAAQLRAWKAGERKNDPLGLMKVVAQRLTDREIDAVAAWFAHQPPSAE